jgi:hypothetical protein
MGISGITLSIIAALLFSSTAPAAPMQAGCRTEWISKTASGQPAIGESFGIALSFDGRFVAFGSAAANLAPGDSNGLEDIFVVDRLIGSIERVSVGTGDVEGNGFSIDPDISNDGRYVVFTSSSSNWDPGDGHPGRDIYLRDRLLKSTELISVHLFPPSITNDGAGHARVSPDGRLVAFHHLEDILVTNDSNGRSDVFLRDRAHATTELLSVNSLGVQSDYQSANPVMSDDGRYVAFISEATTWFPGNSAYWHRAYVYVRDRRLNLLVPVNLGDSGKLGPGEAGWYIDISADGRFLAYEYGWGLFAELTPLFFSSLYVRDLTSGLGQPIAYSVFGSNATPSLHAPRKPSMSADGRFIAFQSEYDEHVLHSGNVLGANVFLHDRLTGLNLPVGLGPNGQWPSIPPQFAGEAYEPVVAPDGSSVAFRCEDPSFGSGNIFMNVYLRLCDWKQPQIYCDSKANSFGCRPSVSFSGSPSVSAGTGFTVQAQELIGQTAGMFFYSTRRAILTPFQGSYLCMEPPVQRLSLQPTGGGLPSSCSGTLSVDFNVWIASGADPTLIAGENVCIQAWTRDAGSAYGSNLSNAIAFVIGF